MPESGSSTSSSVSTLEFVPACSPATLRSAPGWSWPQPCGIETTPGMTSSVTSTGTTTAPARERTTAASPSTSPRRSASSGWTWAVQRCLPLTSIGRLCIHELLERRSRRPTRTMPPLTGSASASCRRATSATSSSGASSILPLGGAQHLGQARLQRAEVDAVRRRLELGQRQPVGPAAQQQVEDPLGAHPRRDLGQQLLGVAAVDGRVRVGGLPARGLQRDEAVERGDVGVRPLAGDDAGEAQQRLPLGRHVGVGREHRGRVVGDVAHGEAEEGDVVVRALQRRGPGEDDVGVAGGLVDVDVDADHEVQPLERRGQAVAVRRAHRRVAGHGEQRAHLALARRLDLLGQARRRQLAEDLAQPAHAAVPAPEGGAAAAPGLAGGVRRADRGAREHRAARAVEVAGEDVEHVDEPARGRPEALRRGADPPVDRGAAARPPARAPCAGSPAPRSRTSRPRPRARTRRPARGRSSSPATCAASGARVGQALVEQRVHEREEQQRVGARADEVVLVGLARGARAPRVDDDDLAAARADRAQAPAHVGRREQAAVGGQRVGAEDEQVVGAVDVGHGNRRPAAEHERRGHLLGVLVDGAGAVEVARLQRLEQRRGRRAGCSRLWALGLPM